MICPHIVYLESKGRASFLGSHKDVLIHLNINQDYFSNSQDVDID